MTRSVLILSLIASLAGFGAGQGAFCLQTPPGLPAGNGQNGAMFDVQATGGTVVIQNFRQSFFTAGITSNMEVYAVTGGGTFVGNETNAGAWTLIGSAPGILSTGPGTTNTLGLNLGYIVPGGTTQGFYVTSSNAQTIAYTNGTGTPGVSTVTSDSFITVTEGVGKSYPFGSTFTPRNWNGDICYDPGSGLFANFTGSPTSGGAPHSIQFTDTSLTSDPAGVQSWFWTFGDGNSATIQNPAHTYLCPGNYDVSLTVTDTINPPSTRTQIGFVSVSNPPLTMVTSGGGVGDLILTPVGTSCFPAAIRGFTLPSFITTPGSPGGGPFLGLTPDAITLFFITQPLIPGGLPHFAVTPGLYPNSGPIAFPAGFFSSLSGASMDVVEVLLDAAGTPIMISNVAQVTF